MTTFNINISESNKCRRCGKGWAVNDTGLCLDCINRGIRRGDYDHILKRKTGTPFEKMAEVQGVKK
jgi:hypothetical protein